MAHPTPPTNTNFQITFLTRLLELSKTYLYRASNLKSNITFHGLSFMAEVSFLATAKNRRFLRFIHNNNNSNDHHHQLLQTGFLEYTEAITTSLISLETILPEECAFMLRCDAILILPRPPLPPTNIRKVRGRQKVRILVLYSNTKNISK